MIINEPVITREVFENGLSNKGTIFDRIKLIKTIMGIWLIQKLRKYCKLTGQRNDYDYLIEQARPATAFTLLLVGASQDRQYIASVTGKTVLAGTVKATAAGNGLSAILYTLKNN